MAKHAIRTLALTFGHVLAVHAAPGGLLPEQALATERPAPVAENVEGPLTGEQIERRVGEALAQRRLLLAMNDLRMQFARDASGTWFLQVTNLRSGCQASDPVGSFEVLSDERVRALSFAVESLIERAHCGALAAEVTPLPPTAPKLGSWVRPAGALYAGGSAAMLLVMATEDAPNLSLAFEQAPSAALSAAFIGGFAGGTATLFVPDSAARPMLELTLFSSTALQALAVGLSPETGIQPFGELAVASGYALSSALVGVDWALSSPSAMLDAPRGASADDVPRRAISPWLVYAPAMLGAMVSLSRAFDPDMAADDRELAMGLGAYALVPALSGLVLGVLGAKRSAEHETPMPWIASGPLGSYGLTVGGSL
jgi:hypothetical protein